LHSSERLNGIGAERK